MIKAIDFRIDGKLHTYAVYYIHENGEKTWGYAQSLAAYNPGECVEITDTFRCYIDFEL